MRNRRKPSIISSGYARSSIMEPTAKGWSTMKDDWQWNLAKALVDRYDLIAHEDLRVGNIVRNHSLAKAIQDASWSGFWDKVERKAKRKGVLTVAVDPEYSTQECPVCHAKHEVALSERTFACPSCGYAAQRDLKASVIILQRALVGMDMPEFTPVEIPTAGQQTGQLGQAVASRVSMN